MSDRTGHVLAAIDGALADAELPDAMRWSPDPAKVAALSIAADPDALDRMVQAMAEALRSAIEAFTQFACDMVDAFRQAAPRAVGPPPGEDARARALRARRERGTGPDRQVQNRPRPRWHA